MSAKVQALRPFRFSRTSDWTRKPPPRDWLIEGLALRKTVMVFNGSGAVGKSLLMQQLMTSCAIGGDFLGQRMPVVSSFGWFGEDPVDELERRAEDINHHYGIAPGDTEGRMTITAADEMDDPVLYHAATRASEGRPSQAWRNITGHVLKEGCQLVVLDNAALIFEGNANYPELVSPFMQECKHLAANMAGGEGGLVVIIQHPSQEGENSGSGQAGARAWSNLARSRLLMSFPKEWDEDSEEICYERVLRTKKNNYGPRKGPLRVKWDQGVFIPVAGRGHGRFSTSEWIEFCSQIVAWVRASVKRGDRLSLTNGAPDHLATRLAKDPAWKMYDRGEIESAAARLVDEGRLVLRDVGKGTRARRLLRTPDTTYPGEENGQGERDANPC